MVDADIFPVYAVHYHLLFEILKQGINREQMRSKYLRANLVFATAGNAGFCVSCGLSAYLHIAEELSDVGKWEGNKEDMGKPAHGFLCHGLRAFNLDGMCGTDARP